MEASLFRAHGKEIILLAISVVDKQEIPPAFYAKPMAAGVNDHFRLFTADVAYPDLFFGFVAF